MLDLRMALAAIIGVSLGLLMLTTPATVLRFHTVGRVPRDRRGRYGEDAEPTRGWRLAVRGIGAMVALLGGYFGWLVVTTSGFG